MYGELFGRGWGGLNKCNIGTSHVGNLRFETSDVYLIIAGGGNEKCN